MTKLPFKKGRLYHLHTTAIITTPSRAREYSFKFIRSFRVTSAKIKRSANPDAFICYEFEVIETNKIMGMFQYQIKEFKEI